MVRKVHRSYRASFDQVGSNEVEKLPRAYDLGALPEPRETTFIARHQVVGARRISACNKDVVRGIGCYLRQVGRNDNARMVLDQLEQLLPEAPANLQLRACQDRSVFPRHGI